MSSNDSSVELKDLRSLTGDERAWEAGPEDAIDGVKPRWVALPNSVAMAASLLRLASESGLAVVPRGGGTKVTWGNPVRKVDLVLETEALGGVVEYSPGDLVVSCGAGMRLDDLQRVLSGHGQMLALDPAHAGATLGGIVATGDWGPLRLRYGGVRDLLIGISYLLPDGSLARAGGKVVKNVAGYDLCKLFTGSLGTLGLIVRVTWRLHPLPVQRQTLVVDLPDAGTARQATKALMQSSLVPSAIAVTALGTGLKLLVLFEGLEPGVVAQMRAATELVHRFGRLSDTPNSNDLWEGYRRLAENCDVVVKIAALPAQLAHVFRTVEQLEREIGSTILVFAHAALGSTLVGFAANEEKVAPAVERLRQECGSAVVLRAPVACKRDLDVWGLDEGAVPLMRRVKQRFDPVNVMNPGRYVGGI